MLAADDSDWGEVQSFPDKKPAAVLANAVRDDWEDDEDEDELPNEELNKKIWEEANSKAAAPMPSFILSSSRPAASPPPPAAFQPALKILKRPTSASPSSSTAPSPAPTESLKEREARYQAARDRIFSETLSSSEAEGDATSQAQSISKKEKMSVASDTTAVFVVRNPLGPEGDSKESVPRKGFGQRRTGPPPSHKPTTSDETVG